MIKVVELFCGTKSFSKVAESKGCESFTIDRNPAFQANLTADILKLEVNDLPKEFRHPDIVWASPPCTCFSVASISTHWTGGKRAYEPKTKEAEISVALAWKTWELINQMKPKYFIIENPRGVLRKLDIFPKEHLTTVCYCQYGDTRMKPTDLWTNVEYNPRMCKNGNIDHEAAPRGAKTGTQGICGAKGRSVVPSMLCDELLNSMRF